MKKYTRYGLDLLLAISITLAFAILGTLLGIDNLNGWYEQLETPMDIDLGVFIVVQTAYYLICIITIFSLIRTDNSSAHRSIWLLLIFIMTYAELWNYVFLIKQDLLVSAITLSVFFVPILFLARWLRAISIGCSYLWYIYLIWLCVDIAWIWLIWTEN
ncbi:hypothetical protein CF392_07000 [Tamilnaduibacter salinus]|uniref:TspO/MBR related protein n=1 Tax=Tamilnaduibacter salinus TaxID=1484056 RepID=A0A2A2I508_9GAMM|nr:hypothetical protein CF392_07000 [Tamilnaduibacter salinus]